ncbi:hypothetical protein Vadar_015257 [Vaccinium darrowii]|uniref:Uncharacterized protein n=1 Tax=Vaccinium darrowii TaxID=229202 RepID=A0ACB7Z405_9ERIC|nr:hypothetical protein Vadar_015257 [Vaccinium darrowii]
MFRTYDRLLVDPTGVVNHETQLLAKQSHVGYSGVGDIGFSVAATVGGGKEEEFTALAIVADAERMCSRRGRSLSWGGLCKAAAAAVGEEEFCGRNRTVALFRHLTMGLEDLEPIFGEAKAQWSAPNSPPLRSFLFRVDASSSSSLRVQVTDFHSNTFQALRSIEQLEDLRDMVGIGGSWSEFIDYLFASLKSGDVKLLLEGESRSQGAPYAKLTAQKSKGLPLISIPLSRLEDAAAKEAMASLSLELYKAFKSMHNLLIQEQEQSCQLTKVISAEQEKNEAIQRQLDAVLYSNRHKSQKMNDKANPGAMLATGVQESPDKLAAQNKGTSKVAKRVVPAYRRAKVRGVLLQDTEDTGDN